MARITLHMRGVRSASVVVGHVVTYQFTLVLRLVHLLAVLDRLAFCHRVCCVWTLVPDAMSVSMFAVTFICQSRAKNGSGNSSPDTRLVATSVAPDLIANHTTYDATHYSLARITITVLIGMPIVLCTMLIVFIPAFLCGLLVLYVSVYRFNMSDLGVVCETSSIIMFAANTALTMFAGSL